MSTDPTQCTGCERTAALEAQRAESAEWLRQAVRWMVKHDDVCPLDDEGDAILTLALDVTARQPECKCPAGYPKEEPATYVVLKHTGDCQRYDERVTSYSWLDESAARKGQEQ